MSDFYTELSKKTRLPLEEIRVAERHMISYQKWKGEPILDEKKFERVVVALRDKMSIGLTFGTLVELEWPKTILSTGPSMATSRGPGFYKTQQGIEGIGVVYRNHSDPNY